jgi:CBS domain-containing protein
MKAKDVMTKPVISVGTDQTVASAIEIMLSRRISGLPVVDGAGSLTGMITEGDFLHRSELGTQRKRPRWLEIFTSSGKLADEYTRSRARKVGEIMTTDPVTATEDAPLEDIVALMEKHHIKRVPIVRTEKPVGIISRSDLLHALATHSGPAASPTQSDSAIRESLVAALSQEKWTPIAMINATVRNGVIDLRGTILDERERQALIVMAENIPGVKTVRDHVVWVDPASGMYFAPDDTTKSD